MMIPAVDSDERANEAESGADASVAIMNTMASANAWAEYERLRAANEEAAINAITAARMDDTGNPENTR